jgi:hypothetical protein
MKKLVMLLLIGCLVSPVSFAGEEIQLAAAIGGGTSSGGPENPNGDDDNRDGGFIPPDEATGGTAAGGVGVTMTKATITAIGVVVAGAVLAVSSGGSSGPSSH